LQSLPLMYDSDEEDYDDFVLIHDMVYDARDDDLKLVRDDPQQRHGLQYPLRRCLAWSQDDDSDASSHDLVNSPSRTQDQGTLQSLIASICTIAAPTIAEVPVRLHNGRGNVVWQQELSSHGDRYTVVKPEEKQ
jgi:hypothetical protein